MCIDIYPFYLFRCVSVTFRGTRAVIRLGSRHVPSGGGGYLYVCVCVFIHNIYVYIYIYIYIRI